MADKEDILSRASRIIELNESPVPIGRAPRALRIGGLAAGLGMGMVSEIIRRIRGGGGAAPLSESLSLLLSRDNVERIVSTLTRMRGAALKVGQMLSIQEDGVGLLPPIIENIFTRLRDSAHQMPKWQMQKVMEEELGANWSGLFHKFEEKPFAAASIGQVHRAWLRKKKGKGEKEESPNESIDIIKGEEEMGIPVAVKIQYPNIADSITSDLDNVRSLLLLGNVLPSGLYLDNTLRVVQRELQLETDYEREAGFAGKFSDYLIKDDIFNVPKVHLATKRVMIMDFIEGTCIDRADLTLEEKNFVCEKVFELILKELFIFNCMQTDPNWSNFLLKKVMMMKMKEGKEQHEKESSLNSIKIGLVDFGATREFPSEFVNNYRLMIEAAANRDRKAIEQLSVKLGFMTGNEAPLMTDANTEAILALGEPFVSEEPFDFGNTDISQRIKQLIPTMLQYRMTAPPDESYSLHRKLSGIFQLCAKMKAKVACKSLFKQIISQKGNN